MHTCKYPHIFEPMTIKGITFKTVYLHHPSQPTVLWIMAIRLQKASMLTKQKPGVVLHLLHSQNPLLIMNIPGVMNMV